MSHILSSTTQLICQLLLTLSFEVCNEVFPVILLLQASEGHFSSLDVLLGSEQVVEKSFLGPGDTCLLVSPRVGVVFHRTGLATEKSSQVGARSVLGIRSRVCVALKALLLKDFCSFSCPM